MNFISTNQGQDVCFYDIDGNTILDDYCYMTYITNPVGFYCMPVQGDYWQMAQNFTTKPHDLMRRIASDMLYVSNLILLRFLLD